MSVDKLVPAPRVVSKPQDVGKSGNGKCFSMLLKDDPMAMFNKQVRFSPIFALVIPTLSLTLRPY